MRNIIIIPSRIARVLRRHFFQNELEQGAFLFAEVERRHAKLSLVVKDHYLVPARAWEVQEQVYLEMKDGERGRIMNRARKRHLCAIDCHSHPGAGDDAWFSPSDVAGITEFAQYAKWKLDGRPFAAMVWGEESVDAVLWQEDFVGAQCVGKIQVAGNPGEILVPTGSWFRAPRGKNRFELYE